MNAQPTGNVKLINGNPTHRGRRVKLPPTLHNYLKSAKEGSHITLYIKNIQYENDQKDSQ